MTEPLLLPPLPPAIPLARVQIVDKDGTATEVFASWLAKLLHWLSYMGDPATPRSDGTLAEYLRPPEPEAPPPVIVYPSFSAHLGGVPVNHPTPSPASGYKIPFAVEEWDTGSCFNTASAVFQPAVAGVYQVNLSVEPLNLNSGLGGAAVLWRNGNVYKFGSYTAEGANNSPISVLSTLVRMNGTSDYLEFYYYSEMTPANLFGDPGSTYANAAWVAP